jgi:hypothetical protein
LRAVDGFDEELPQFQDWDFVLRAYEAGKIGILRRPLILYAIHDRPSIGKAVGDRNLTVFYKKHLDRFKPVYARLLVTVYLSLKRRWGALAAFRKAWAGS